MAKNKPYRPSDDRLGFGRHPSDPTAKEIRAWCERIQSTWTATERERRRRNMPGRVSVRSEDMTVPMVKVRDMDAARRR